MAAKSQRITESGDYIAIHSYYPRGRKHEPFRAAATAAAAAAIHHRRPSLPLLSGLFFPEALTTNDSGATPECGNERCTPGARGGKCDSNEWVGSITSPNLKTAASSSGGRHAAAALRGRKATFAHLGEAFRRPRGSARVDTLCQQG